MLCITHSKLKFKNLILNITNLTFIFYFTDDLPQFFISIPSILLPQFNNTVNSMEYPNNMNDNTSNDVEK